MSLFFSEEECPVCFEPCRGHRLSPCNHSICESCMRKLNRNTCPLCRRVFETDSVPQQRMRVTFRPVFFRGQRFVLSDEEDGDGIRFEWSDGRRRFEDETSLLQHGDVITHIDGFEVQSVQWTASVFQRLMIQQREFSLLVRWRVGSTSLRDTLLIE